VINARSARPGRLLLALGILAPLAACDSPEGAKNIAVAPQEERTQDEKPVKLEGGLPGTPMAERVAEIGLLNKRNGITQKFSMKPGEALRSGNAIIRLRACETSAPWEMDKDTGAFVQLDVLESRDDKWHRAFSGWLFKERPERNVVLHPIYDVWVINCAMSWPETGEETVRVADRASRSSDSNQSESSASNAAEASPSPPATSPSASPSNPE
jgi:hypothetical protein